MKSLRKSKSRAGEGQEIHPGEREGDPKAGSEATVRRVRFILIALGNDWRVLQGSNHH